MSLGLEVQETDSSLVKQRICVAFSALKIFEKKKSNLHITRNMFNSNIKMKKQERNRLWGASDKRTCAVVAWGCGWVGGRIDNKQAQHFFCVCLNVSLFNFHACFWLSNRHTVLCSFHFFLKRQ